jgi:hypothetical protein
MADGFLVSYVDFAGSSASSADLPLSLRRELSVIC